MEICKEQELLCQKYGVIPFAAPISLKVGISLNVKDGTIIPLNGLRHQPEGDTTGWYIWAGIEYSYDADFFVPLHVEHLSIWRPEIIKFLALPPGYRFLLGEYEDVWFDASLLEVE